MQQFSGQKGCKAFHAAGVSTIKAICPPQIRSWPAGTQKAFVWKKIDTMQWLKSDAM